MAASVFLTVIVWAVFGSRIARAAEFNVYSPHVVRSENEIEARSFYEQKQDDSEIDGTQVNKIAVGRGVTDFWATEIYAEFEGEGHQSQHFDAVEWENRFQLTPQGKYWADLGLLVEAELPVRSRDPNSIRVGPLLEKQIGRTVTTVNLFLERQYGPDGGNDVDFFYAARVKWRITPYFEPALEAYGGSGDIRHSKALNKQRHQVGPGFYGHVPVAGNSSVKYSAALLFGVTGASPDTILVGRLEYEFF